MTRTFNPESYGELLAKYQPKIITTDEENEQAIALAEKLEHRPNKTPEEETLLELLITLIEKFEEVNYPILKGTASSMLLHLMEAQNMTKDSFLQVFGSIENVDKVINSNLKITSQQAQELGSLFHVDASLFMED
ncbi:helix-turn-helix domain-containing protein [Calothrix sp. CCY 0018]|uniref:helix-turn-helix domain-containing protein n=1 Tax=Calothrix sp. CCY 0018 TaxID=3103864 RepID=UPI0039C637E0